MTKDSFQIIFAVLLLIFVLLVCGIGFYIIKRKGNPLPKLFHEFDKKIWMTLGLGIIFFGFYFVLVMGLSWMLSSDRSQKIFSFFRHYTIESIYIGLFIFAFITLSIYLARMLIKYLYSKHND